MKHVTAWNCSDWCYSLLKLSIFKYLWKIEKFYFNLTESRTSTLWLIIPGCWPLDHRGYSEIETSNIRIKQFCCMNQRFLHSLHLHPRFFHPVANLIELMIEIGNHCIASTFNCLNKILAVLVCIISFISHLFGST
jgi:hypothetical protein